MLSQKHIFHAQCLFCRGKKCRHERHELTVHTPHTRQALNGLNSHFITDDIIASQRPSERLINTYDIIEQCLANNITDVLNLQETFEHPICGDGILESIGFSYDPETFMQSGISYYNFPIHDMHWPTFQVLTDIMQVIHASLRKKDRKIFIHCHSGYGRTGLVVACYLLWDRRMKRASDAIEYVRRRRPKSIQTTGQIKIIHRFEKYLKSLCEVYVLDEKEAQCSLNVFLESELAEKTINPAASHSASVALGEGNGEDVHDTNDNSSPADSQIESSAINITTDEQQVIDGSEETTEHDLDTAESTSRDDLDQTSTISPLGSVTTPVSLFMSDFYFPSTPHGTRTAKGLFPSSVRRTKSQTDMSDIDDRENDVMPHDTSISASITPVHNATLQAPFELALEDVSLFRREVTPCIHLSTLMEKQGRLLSGSESRLLRSLPKVVHIICNNLQRAITELPSKSDAHIEEFASSLIESFNIDQCSDATLRKVLFLKRKVNQNYWSVLETCHEPLVLMRLLVDFFDQLHNSVLPKNFFHSTESREISGEDDKQHVGSSATTHSSTPTPTETPTSAAVPSTSNNSAVDPSTSTPDSPASSLAIFNELPPSRYEIILRIARFLSFLKIDDTKCNCKELCESLCTLLAREANDKFRDLMEQASRDDAFVRKTRRELSHESNRRASLMLSRTLSDSKRLHISSLAANDDEEKRENSS